MKIKVQLIRLVPLTKEGRERWNPKIRVYLKDETFRALPSNNIETEELDTERKVCDYVWRYAGEGKTQVNILTLNKETKIHRWKKRAYVQLKSRDKFNREYEVLDLDTRKLEVLSWFKEK